MQFKRKHNKKGRYYEPELDWNEVSDKVDGYLAKATLLFQREALEEAATIALQVLRSIGGNYIDEDFLYNDGDILVSLVVMPEIYYSK